MGLLSGASTSHGFVITIRGVARLHRLLGLISYVAGIVGFCLLAHNDFNGKVYFSENALQPGLAGTTFGQQDRVRHDSLVRDLTLQAAQSNGAIPESYLKEKFTSFGLEPHAQNFSVRHPFSSEAEVISSGRNVYGIVRAPRTASTESVLIAAAWREDNIQGVALAITLGALMRKQAYWAKDIVILIVDQDVWGTEAWLQAYHGTAISAYLESESLSAWAGSIQAALCLDIGSSMFSRIELLTDGINGQMPNLDLINVLTTMTQYTARGLEVTFNGRGGSHANGDHEDAIKERLFTLLLGAAQQASMQPTGTQSPFMRYRIEAATIKTVTDGYAPYNVASIGSITEQAMRCINNLLERFHQSFFFYLNAGGGRYVSIGMYMPPAGLLLLPLVLRALVLWFSCVGIGQKEEPASTDSEPSEPGAPKRQVAYLPLPQHGSQVGMLLSVVILSGAVAFVSPWIAHCLPVKLAAQQSAVLHSVLPLVCIAVSLLLVLPLALKRLLPSKEHVESFIQLLLCLTILLWTAVLGVVTLINMPFAAALALLSVPVLFFMPTSRPQSVLWTIPQLASLVLITPWYQMVAAAGAWQWLHTMQMPEDYGSLVTRAWLAWQHSPVQFELLGIWLYPLVTLCMYPLLALCWCVVLGRIMSVAPA